MVSPTKRSFSGIFVEGVPLEEHLIDDEKKKLYDDTQAEIAEQKSLTYHSRGIRMTVKHDTRPSKVKRITSQEYYMKDNIAKCESGGEYVLTILQDGLPQTAMSIGERFVHWQIKIGMSGARQAIMKVAKRYPDLLIITKTRPVTYCMIDAACKITHEDLLMLWRKKISWEQMVEINQPLKRALTSKVLESPDAKTIGFVDVLQKLDELLGRVIGMETNITDLNDCNNGLERRVHKIEERMSHYLEDDTGSRHVLDINVNFNIGRKEE